MYCDDRLLPRREVHAALAYYLGRMWQAKHCAQRRPVRANLQETREKIGPANATRRREELTREAEHGAEAYEQCFQRETLPQIPGVRQRELARRSGLSLMYCSQIRRGLHVPHPRHWSRLAAASPSAS
jgi:hypothetical protein